MSNQRFVTLLSASLAAATAFGYPAESEPETLTLVGVKSDLSYLPLAIGHIAPGTDGGKITVRNVIQTAQLSVGDELYVYDHAAMTYNLFRLAESVNEDGERARNWMPQPAIIVDTYLGSVSTEKRESVGIDTPLDAGYALWLHRRGDTSATVWAMGAVATNVVTTVPVGSYALVGVPGHVESVDLAKVSTFPSSCEFFEFDQIQVPLEDGRLERHFFYGGKWYREDGESQDRKLHRGQAFWYLHKNNATKAVVFKW